MGTQALQCLDQISAISTMVGVTVCVHFYVQFTLIKVFQC